MDTPPQEHAGPASSSTATDGFSALYVRELRMANFRGLGDCHIEFEPDLTLLVGRNNAGKSRVLRALAIGLGAVPADRDDLTLPSAIEATIEIVLAPLAVDGVDDKFDDRTARRLGSAIQAVSEDPIRERFAWRTTIRLSQEGFGVRSDHKLLTFDLGSQRWEQAQNARSANLDQRSVVEADLVETRRDLVDEMARRGSPVRRVLDDLEIAPDRRTELEDSLSKLNGQITDSSGSLAAITSALEELSRAVDTVGSPSIHPLPVRLEDLARSISIELNTGTTGLPMRFHGAGSRSLSSLQVQSVLYDRRLGRDGRALRPHPVSLIEEPEAHLHPQAQFELEPLLSKIQGQVIVSTHSTHLISVAEPKSLRILKALSGSTTVVDLRPGDNSSDVDRARRPSMHLEEMEKVRRLVERPFGELLFASVVVIGDGATERALLPPLVRYALRDRAHGVCVVDPGSLGSEHATAIIKLSNLLEIPWILFSDSDPSGRMAAEKAVRSHGGGDMTKVVWVPQVPDAGATAKGAATEQMFVDFDEDLCRAACKPLGYDSGDGRSILKFMSSKKGAVGRLLASELITRYPRAVGAELPRNWPLALQALISKLDDLLPIQRRQP